MDIIIKCKHCNKELGKATFEIWRHLYMGYTIEGKRKAFCSEECFNNYWNQYLVEEYNGNKIYKITRDGISGYIPYIGSSYYFETLEDCKSRISQMNVSIVDMNMFGYMNNQLFGE